MSTIRCPAAVVVVLLLGGCVPTIESARFGAATPAPRAEAEVRVYSTKLPDCAYEEIGVVTGPATDLFRSLQSIVDGMRRHAARMGGDALVQFRPVEVPAESGGSQTRSGYTATVVRFTEACPSGD